MCPGANFWIRRHKGRSDPGRRGLQADLRRFHTEHRLTLQTRRLTEPPPPGHFPLIPPEPLLKEVWPWSSASRTV